MISSDKKTMKKPNIINDDDEAADDNLIEIIVILECQLKQKTTTRNCCFLDQKLFDIPKKQQQFSI